MAVPRSPEDIRGRLDELLVQCASLSGTASSDINVATRGPVSLSVPLEQLWTFLFSALEAVRSAHGEHSPHYEALDRCRARLELQKDLNIDICRAALKAAQNDLRNAGNPGMSASTGGVDSNIVREAIAARRELLQVYYDEYMKSPTAQVGWDRDDADPSSAVRVREAQWLHQHGLIIATFGAAGDFRARLTVKGRDFVDAGGFDRGDSPAEPNPRLTGILSMQKPRIFIGSSVEGLRVAEHVQLGLDHEAECTLWSQGVFGLSGGTLDSLLRAVDDYEFAVLVLTPDDLTHKREATKNSPRDNVLFELGLFMGALGRERTYVVYCRDEKLDLPTDLAGITCATFAKRSDGNLHAAIGPVCTQIKTAISSVRVAEVAP